MNCKDARRLVDRLAPRLALAPSPSPYSSDRRRSSPRLVDTGDASDGTATERERLEEHLASCAACRQRRETIERALAVARETFAVPVPAGLAERAIARASSAAAASGRAPHRLAWWNAALPIAWKAALGVNIVGAALAAWVLTRSPRHAPAPQPTAVDGLVDAETDAVLSRALGLGGRGDE